MVGPGRRGRSTDGLVTGRFRNGPWLARQALTWLQNTHRDDPHLEILLPAARAVLAAGGDEEKEMIRALLQVYLALALHA